MKKKTGYLLICIFALLSSCKKSSTGSPAETTSLIQVKEYKTNVPLPDVKISLYYCSSYDAANKCQSTSLFTTHTTDEKGQYAISQDEIKKADEGVILSKPQYWDVKGGSGENPMEPEAWVNVTLKTSNTYPDTSFFEITTSSELGNGNALSFRAPKDSTVHFRLFGNEMNEVKWVVVTELLTCQFYCPRDTFAFGNLTLNPQKFETLTSSVDY
jgi:hypothetical protein